VEESTETRVLVIDDHQTFAELLAGALDREPDLLSIGHATTAREGIALCERLQPDVVVMDVQLPDLDGFAATRKIVAASPEVRVVVLTAHATAEFVAKAAEAGACGFMPKDGALAIMLDTLRSCRRGSLSVHPALITRLTASPEPPASAASSLPPLTDREREVLQCMGNGQDVRAIARQLNISVHTCRGYVKALLAKLGAHSQLEAVVIAAKAGILQLEKDQ
jgi:DNA-binding NarL/FixJ family response regulator